MGQNPTSTNGQLNLATANTTHAGMTTGPTDICKLPNNMPAPFPNIAPVDRNAKTTTTPLTSVNGQPIIITTTTFGDPSDPAHAGVNKGVKSGTYRGYAQITKGSPDLRTEGKPPARHTDPTFQNNANTVGIVRDMKAALDADAKNAAILKRCTIVELEIKQDDSDRVAVGYLLEVTEGSTITCTATRKNMAAATAGNGKAPPGACTTPPNGWLNTKWRVLRQGGKIRRASKLQLPFDLDETKEGVDVFKLTEDWVGKKPAISGAPAKGAPNTGGGGRDDQKTINRAGEVAARNVAKPDVENPGRRAALGLPTTPKMFEDKAAYDREVAKARSDASSAMSASIESKKAAFEAGAKQDKMVLTSLQMFRDVWSSFTPPNITISAAACTGAYAGLVRVYPAGQFEYDVVELFKTFVRPFEAAMDGLKNVLQGVDPAAGKRWDIGILNRSLFGGNAGKSELPTIKIQWEWKELAKDSTEPGGPKKHQCGLSWGVVIGVEKLVFARADLSVSLFVIAGGPGIGGVAKKILEWCGIEFELGIAVELAVGVTALIGRDEYHVKKWGDIDTSLTVIACIYLVARAGSLGTAKVDFTFAFSVTFADIRYGQGVKPPIEIEVKDRRFTITFQSTITAPVRGFRQGRKFPEQPYNLITPQVWPDEWKTVPLT